ncbi:crossover junction endodeoxyribonuclease RuvC [Bdellovibrio bacteriovorus W]|nr:crossover junction endodeoxyribonuclease RuvC [Bdellovibrio bacteriovorus W]
MAAVILGVDPGTRITGFGIIRLDQGRIEHINHGVIVMDEKSSIPVRMKELGLSFREVLEKYQPQHVVIEKIFLGKNADSAFKLGHARGVIMAEAGMAGADVYEYATRSVKKGVTGNGGASKEEVQMVLQTLLNLKTITRIDASDALAMACHHIYEERKRAIMERAVSI